MILSALVVLMVGCTTYTPKPHGYPRIEFPEKDYVYFDKGCPYAFAVPKYAIVESDTHETSEPCWYNIKFPTFDATIYLSYKEISSPGQLDTLSEEAYELAMKNNIRADVIDEREIYNPSSENRGMIYELYGPSATPFNFYLTDSKKHFIRGSFYFDNETKNDSVAPIFEFLKEDMMKLINSVNWESNES